MPSKIDGREKKTFPLMWSMQSIFAILVAYSLQTNFLLFTRHPVSEPYFQCTWKYKHSGNKSIFHWPNTERDGKNRYYFCCVNTLDLKSLAFICESTSFYFPSPNTDTDT